MNIKPTQLESGNMSVSREKLVDVKKLLESHFGEEWFKNPRLSYYLKPLERLDVHYVCTKEESLCSPEDHLEEFPVLSV